MNHNHPTLIFSATRGKDQDNADLKTAKGRFECIESIYGPEPSHEKIQALFRVEIAALADDDDQWIRRDMLKLHAKWHNASTGPRSVIMPDCLWPVNDPEHDLWDIRVVSSYASAKTIDQLLANLPGYQTLQQFYEYNQGPMLPSALARSDGKIVAVPALRGRDGVLRPSDQPKFARPVRSTKHERSGKRMARRGAKLL